MTRSNDRGGWARTLSALFGLLVWTTATLGLCTLVVGTVSVRHAALALRPSRRHLGAWLEYHVRLGRNAASPYGAGQRIKVTYDPGGLIAPQAPGP